MIEIKHDVHTCCYFYSEKRKPKSVSIGDWTLRHAKCIKCIIARTAGRRYKGFENFPQDGSIQFLRTAEKSQKVNKHVPATHAGEKLALTLASSR